MFEWFCDMWSKSVCSESFMYVLVFQVQNINVSWNSVLNIISEYCHASAILDNVYALYLEDGNICSPVLKNKSQLCFYSKHFSSYCSIFYLIKNYINSISSFGEHKISSSIWLISV